MIFADICGVLAGYSKNEIKKAGGNPLSPDFSTPAGRTFLYSDVSHLAMAVATMYEKAVSPVTVLSDDTNTMYIGFDKCSHSYQSTSFFSCSFDDPRCFVSYTPKIMLIADPEKLTVEIICFSPDINGVFRSFREQKQHQTGSTQAGTGILPDITGLEESIRLKISDLLKSTKAHLVPCYQEFQRQVETITGEIDDSRTNVKKAVLTREAVFNFSGESLDLKQLLMTRILERLTCSQVESHFYGELSVTHEPTGKEQSAAERQEAGELFLSYTPEKLFRISGMHIKCDSLAGSISTEERQNLLKDNKNLKENAIVENYLYDRLQRICSKVQVSDPKLKDLSYISHILVELTGELKEECTLDGITDLLHPTPATLGFPRSDARDLLKRIGCQSHGRFASIGGIRHGKDALALVLLRSADITAHTLKLYGGAGIMAESTPESEWNETALKMTAVLRQLTRDDSVTGEIFKGLVRR